VLQFFNRGIRASGKNATLFAKTERRVLIRKNPLFVLYFFCFVAANRLLASDSSEDIITAAIKTHATLPFPVNFRCSRSAPCPAGGGRGPAMSSVWTKEDATARCATSTRNRNKRKGATRRAVSLCSVSGCVVKSCFSLRRR